MAEETVVEKKVMSKAFHAVFRRIVQRARPVPVGSSDMTFEPRDDSFHEVAAL
ncbi:hypothetical protein [Streptomyces sp. NPDC060184]|uniref:hypothetical protein n=1 Tax=Streptomyces sp. NPDC060184 TaxID=3347064 RepID=UPI0036553FF7